MLRRSKSSPVFIIFAACAFYFGSLYLVARPPSRMGSVECFSSSSIIQNDESMYAQSLSDDEVVLMAAEGEEQQQLPEEPAAVIAHAKDVLLSEAYSQQQQQSISPVKTTDSNTTTITDSDRARAAIVILCRNNELYAMRRTLREFEDRFNRKFQYPYVFLNDEEFTDVFKESILALTSAPVTFGLVPQSMWSVPASVNASVMNERLTDYQARGVLYGGSLSYRHMCRFNSGFFYNHPLLADYEYYWRVEPGVHFYCDLDYDPFVFMKKNNKLYSFTITLQEIPETIPTIWEHTLRFAHKHNLKTNLLRMFGDETGYNLCHFWSNFEIASLDLWRGERYQAYFDYLDATGNFFYERWGDAIVHSLATGLFLNKSDVHFFNDIGYKHDDFAHCIDDGVFGKCMCPEDVSNFDYAWGSCMPNWDQYPEQGYRWDFKSNGDQIFDDERVINRPEFATSAKKERLTKKQ